MDANNKSNFINSVANDKPLVCPNCNANNKVSAKFCVSCGAKFEAVQAESAAVFAPVKEEAKAAEAAAPAFASVKEEVKTPETATPAFAPAKEEAKDPEATTPAFASVKDEAKTPAHAAPAETETVKKTVKYVEPEDAFAKGLPSWSIEPPQIMVRRHKK